MQEISCLPKDIKHISRVVFKCVFSYVYAHLLQVKYNFLPHCRHVATLVKDI